MTETSPESEKWKIVCQQLKAFTCNSHGVPAPMPQSPEGAEKSATMAQAFEFPSSVLLELSRKARFDPI